MRPALFVMLLLTGCSCGATRESRGTSNAVVDVSSRRTPQQQADFDLLAGHVDALYARQARDGYASLNIAERTVYSVWELEGEVNNGGFDQYFFNSAHGLLDVVGALHRIGAAQMAQATQDAFAVFPQPGPSNERFTRQTQLEALTDAQRDGFNALDERFYQYPDDLESLLAKYAREHATEIRH